MHWNNVNEKIPNVFAGKFRVKKEDGLEMDAFFYQDKISWISFYGEKTSYWWDAIYPYDRLDDVTHWMPLPKTPRDLNEM